MMIHYNDEALFREFVAKGKAYGNGKYDFTFEDRYIIYHVKDVALRYIALKSIGGKVMDAHTRKVYVPMTETGFYILFCLQKPNHGYGIVQMVEKLTDGERWFDSVYKRRRKTKNLYHH